MSGKKISKLESDINRDLYLFRNIIYLLANTDPDRISEEHINCLAISLLDHIDNLLSNFESFLQEIGQESGTPENSKGSEV